MGLPGDPAPRSSRGAGEWRCAPGGSRWTAGGPLWRRRCVGERARLEARGWLSLGDAHRSERLYRQVLSARLSTRNRVSYGAGLADALLKQGSRQDAVAAAADVLSALESGVTSMRCLNRLRIVRQAAG